MRKEYMPVTKIQINASRAVAEEFMLRCASVLNPTFFAVVQELMEVLQKDGHIPSVYNVYSKPTNSHTSYGRLANVSLAAHAINTSTIFMECIDRRMPLDQLTMIACLGHDIGKIPRYLKLVDGTYSRIKHARASALVVQDLIGARIPLQQAELIVDAIRFHHENGSGLIWEKVVNADRRAREREEFTIITSGGITK